MRRREKVCGCRPGPPEGLAPAGIERNRLGNRDRDPGGLTQRLEVERVRAAAGAALGLEAEPDRDVRAVVAEEPACDLAGADAARAEDREVERDRHDRAGDA